MRAIHSLGILALLGAFSFFASPAHAAESIAVVDMVRLISEHPESQELDKRYKAVEEKAKADWELQKQEIERVGREIQLLSRNDPERRVKEKRFEQMRVMAEFSRKWALQQGALEYVRSLERLYKAVSMQVRSYARGNGITLVLQKVDSDKELGAQSPEDFGLKQRLRLVVYHAPAVDITDAVLAQMKAAVRGGGGSGVPVPPSVDDVPPAGN